MSRSWTNADDFRPPTPTAPPADDDLAHVRAARGVIHGLCLSVPCWLALIGLGGVFGLVIGLLAGTGAR